MSVIIQLTQIFIIVYFGLCGFSWKIYVAVTCHSLIKGKPVKFLTVEVAETWFVDWETSYSRCGVFK